MATVGVLEYELEEKGEICHLLSHYSVIYCPICRAVICRKHKGTRNRMMDAMAPNNGVKQIKQDERRVPEVISQSRRLG